MEHRRTGAQSGGEALCVERDCKQPLLAGTEMLLRHGIHKVSWEGLEHLA